MQLLMVLKLSSLLKAAFKTIILLLLYIPNFIRFSYQSCTKWYFLKWKQSTADLIFQNKLQDSHLKISMVCISQSVVSKHTYLYSYQHIWIKMIQVYPTVNLSSYQLLPHFNSTDIHNQFHLIDYHNFLFHYACWVEWAVLVRQCYQLLTWLLKIPRNQTSKWLANTLSHLSNYTIMC